LKRKKPNHESVPPGRKKIVIAGGRIIEEASALDRREALKLNPVRTFKCPADTWHNTIPSILLPMALVAIRRAHLLTSEQAR
jgi:hypothetical protein